MTDGTRRAAIAASGVRRARLEGGQRSGDGRSGAIESRDKQGRWLLTPILMRREEIARRRCRWVSRRTYHATLLTLVLPATAQSNGMGRTHDVRYESSCICSE